MVGSKVFNFSFENFLFFTIKYTWLVTILFLTDTHLQTNCVCHLLVYYVLEKLIRCEAMAITKAEHTHAQSLNTAQHWEVNWLEDSLNGKSLLISNSPFGFVLKKLPYLPSFQQRNDMGEKSTYMIHTDYNLRVKFLAGTVSQSLSLPRKRRASSKPDFRSDVTRPLLCSRNEFGAALNVLSSGFRGHSRISIVIYEGII